MAASEDKTVRLEFGDTGIEFSVPFLVELLLGNVEGHFGPVKRTASVGLMQNADGGRSVSAGFFSNECLGMFNRAEVATLKLGRESVGFVRTGYQGFWEKDGRQIAESRLAWNRRWFYWGGNVTTCNDGTVLCLKTPWVGPSTPQLGDCVCEAHIGEQERIRLCLARPRDKGRAIFDRTDAGLLERLTAENRAVLLGEFLRLRALYI